MIVLGLIHITGSLVGSFPVAGTITRTAINSICGVKTTFGGVITGIMILMALGFLTTTFAYIPKPTLAAVILVTCLDIISFKTFALLWRLKSIIIIKRLFNFCRNFAHFCRNRLDSFYCHHSNMFILEFSLWHFMWSWN